MGETIYASDRTFQLWLYTVSNGQLLLRSTKSDTDKTRIDLLFKNVQVLNLPSLLNGLRIVLGHLGDSAVPDEVVTIVRDKIYYGISSGEFRGYVIAGSFSQKEDDREYHEPSSFETFS